MKMDTMKVTEEVNKMTKYSLRSPLNIGQRNISAQENKNKKCVTLWMMRSLVLCIALLAAGFMVTAAPARAADVPTVAITPVEGVTGSTVLVRLSYCVPNTSVWVTFGTGSTGISVTIPTDDRGFGSGELIIGLIRGGAYQISANDGGSVPIKSVNFKVLPSVMLSQAGGLVGDTVELWGNGFAAKKPIIVYLDDVKVTTSETDELGSFPNTRFVFPPSASGKHTILTKDSEGTSVKSLYNINPRVILNPVSGCVGDTIQVSAAGFPAVANVILSYDGTDMATIPTDARGNIITTFKIPPSGDALHKIKLTDGLNPVISDITVVPTLTISQDNGWVGMGVTLNGTGFRCGNALLAAFDNVKLAGSTVGQNGSFTHTFNIPKSKAGLHNINVTDGVNNRTVSFTMESTPPPAPGLVAPSEGTRFTKDARFLWETVSDPSGVSYVIEVADDARFSQPIISQTGMMQTYLDVPDSAKTLPGKSDLYYWRVKAVDGASNIGGWSVIGSFYKGVTVESVLSDMPAWTKFALIGIGLLLFVFMVIFIRRNIMRVRYSDEADADEYQDNEYSSEWEQSSGGNR
jgi:hypothetical protein